MDLGIAFLVSGFGFELLMYSRIGWISNRVLLGINCVLVFVALAIMVITSGYSLVLVLIAYISFFRVLNLARIYLGRSHVYRLYNAGRITSLSLIILTLAVVALGYISDLLVINVNIWLYLIAFLQLIVSAVVLTTTKRNIKGVVSFSKSSKRLSKDLPSITVAIPARNETDDLRACLDSLLLSDYPKLEILVLDDSSQTKRTPEIIRSYAHNGVRFLAGKEPPQRWLPKNYAYDQLVEASSGQLILFCGVDVRFGRYSLSEMVNLILDKQVDMMSVIPSNKRQAVLKLTDYIYQPSRYAWELTLPRNVTMRPPSLSTCWLINKDSLQQAGGFDSLMHSVTPERHLARYCVNNLRGYCFEAANQQMQLSSQKTVQEQYSTAIRIRYPSLHRRPELVCLTTFGQAFVLVGPFALLIFSIWIHNWPLAIAASISAVTQMTAYNSIVELTYRRASRLGFLMMPVAAVWDIILQYNSMLQYEFGSVYWKGRNVSLPVMQSTPNSTSN